MFGERLMQLRKRSGLSQNELAEAMGISRQAISKYENNLAEPDLQKIQQFTMILGVSYADLLGNEPPEPKPAANRPSSAITITSLINDRLGNYTGFQIAEGIPSKTAPTFLPLASLSLVGIKPDMQLKQSLNRYKKLCCGVMRFITLRIRLK